MGLRPGIRSRLSVTLHSTRHGAGSLIIPTGRPRPSCLGDIKYSISRLTKDKRRGGVFIRQLNDRVSVFNISFSHASTVPPPHTRGPGDYPSCVYRSPGSGPLREITSSMLVYLSLGLTTTPGCWELPQHPGILLYINKINNKQKQNKQTTNKIKQQKI